MSSAIRVEEPAPHLSSEIMQYINAEMLLLPAYFQELSVKEKRKYVFLKLWKNLIVKSEKGTITYTNMINRLLPTMATRVTIEASGGSVAQAIKAVFDSLKEEAKLIASSLDIVFNENEFWLTNTSNTCRCGAMTTVQSSASSPKQL